MRKREVTKLIIEGGLIVFSVLFALFLDRLAEEYKTQQQKKIALERIRNELTANQTLVSEIITRHQLIVRNLTKANRNPKDSLQIQLFRDGYVDWRLLAEGKSIYPRYSASTAWEAAKSTGIIAEFDYPTVEACTDVYSSQELIANGTMPKIVDDLFEVDNSRMDKKLIKLRLEFEELIAQEQTLLYRLQEATKRIEE